MGTASLRVADAERSLGWYRDLLGFEVLERAGRRITLGAGGEPLLHLNVEPGTTPRPKRTTGLYHIAFLLPGRADLGGRIARLIKAQVPMGAADHDVSEAVYIWDPDNNGLELYRDRPAGEWTWEDGQVLMRNRPLDYDGILAEKGMPERASGPMPAGTVIGHMHLQVGDLASAEKFYCEAIGFTPTRRRSDGALFMAAGRYHHHLAVNVWDSLGGPQPPENAAGLEEFEIVLPDASALSSAKARLRSAGYAPFEEHGGLRLLDPWGIPLRLAT